MLESAISWLTKIFSGLSVLPSLFWLQVKFWRNSFPLLSTDRIPKVFQNFNLVPIRKKWKAEPQIFMLMSLFIIGSLVQCYSSIPADMQSNSSRHSTTHTHTHNCYNMEIKWQCAKHKKIFKYNLFKWRVLKKNINITVWKKKKKSDMHPVQPCRSTIHWENKLKNETCKFLTMKPQTAPIQ